jgi:uncharacterized protein (DUF4415 family)
LGRVTLREPWDRVFHRPSVLPIERRAPYAPKNSPTKEQVAIRFDQDVLLAFRASGPGWQTRMNAALKEWLADHPAKRKGGRAQSSR